MTNFAAPLLQGTCSTSFKTEGAVYSTGAHRIMLYEVELGQTGGLSSTDCQVQYDLSRFSQTAILTASTVVANLLDAADGTVVAIFQNNATTELTYTTAGAGLALKQWAINQRGFMRWRALDDGDNIIIAATNLVGIGIRGLSSNFAATLIGNINAVER
jgi:hypothetical protein